jgi:hypothetical protein
MNILVHTMITGAIVMQGMLSNAQSGPSVGSLSNEEIRPFKVHIPQRELIDLKRRILETRWPDKETVSDQSQGAH